MASNGSGKGKYALDAGSLLDGILSETQSEAQQEEERLKADLKAKESQAEQQRAAEAERRRSQAQAALAAERDRQERARSRRDAVLQTMSDLEAEREAGSLTPSAPHAAVPAGPHDYASSVGISQSYSHLAVTKRPSWLVPVALAATILIVGGGITAAVLVLGAPSIDPTSYPKSALDVDTVSRNPLETIGFNYVPQPEPVRPAALDATATASTEAERERGHSRNHDRDRDHEEESTQTNAPLDIDLDGSGIFDRGSE